MSIGDSSTRRETAALVGDAALFSAVLVLAAPLALVLGPVAAWLLHRRRLDRYAVTSGLLGLLGALVSGGLVIGLIALYARFSGYVDASDLSSGIVLMVVFGTILLGTVLALDVDALRDLSHARRLHVWLDIARLSSTLMLAVGSVALTMVQMANPASQVGDAGPFALVFAAVGALTMLFWGALLPHVREVGDRRRPT